MDIIQRNCIRLLREGAFNEHLQMEPMSAWKWKRALVFAQMHGIVPWVYDGILLSKDDFFLNIDDVLMEQWRQAALDASTDQTEEEEEEAETETQHLTNPLLNHKLQKLMQQPSTTLDLLLRLIGISRSLLTSGINLREMVELAIYLRTTHDAINYDQLVQWIALFHMGRMARLQGALLIVLFDFPQDDIRFTQVTDTKEATRMVVDFLKTSGNELAEWYFTQGDNIFIGTNNSRSLVWHVRHSFKYMHLYPTEAPTNFLANFAHSLSHIEE